MNHMKIYSWNVYCYNRQMPEVAMRIRTLDFDILCLQEVTPALLEELKRMPFYLTYHVDVLRFFGKRRDYNYVAILSRVPHKGSGTFQFMDFPFPGHTRLFIAFMSLFKWSFLTERGAIYADYETAGQTLRVFSVHLTLWGPGNRQKEFDEVVRNIEPGKATVVCGDFNVIEYGPMKVLNWILGAPLAHAVPWYPERDLFEERFRDAGLTNALRGKITHPFSRSQLDHILVSKDIEVEHSSVDAERHGSDHALVGAVLRL